MTEIAILERQVVYRSSGIGFNRCARRIHDIKGGLLPLSIHHAHLSNEGGSSSLPSAAGHMYDRHF
jgi:hypothetical protein